MISSHCLLAQTNNRTRGQSVLNPEYILFGNTVYSCYCKLKNFWFWFLTFRWKRHFRGKNYIENYFYLLKSTKRTKTTSQKCWRSIWEDFFGRPYRTNGIKTRLGSPVSIWMWRDFVLLLFWFCSFTCTVRLLFHSLLRFSSCASKTDWLEKEN